MSRQVVTFRSRYPRVILGWAVMVGMLGIAFLLGMGSACGRLSVEFLGLIALSIAIPLAVVTTGAVGYMVLTSLACAAAAGGLIAPHMVEAPLLCVALCGVLVAWLVYEEVWPIDPDPSTRD